MEIGVCSHKVYTGAIWQGFITYCWLGDRKYIWTVKTCASRTRSTMRYEEFSLSCEDSQAKDDLRPRIKDTNKVIAGEHCGVKAIVQLAGA